MGWFASLFPQHSNAQSYDDEDSPDDQLQLKLSCPSCLILLGNPLDLVFILLSEFLKNLLTFFDLLFESFKFFLDPKSLFGRLVGTLIGGELISNDQTQPEADGDDGNESLVSSHDG
jgi:hypothetical protein